MCVCVYKYKHVSASMLSVDAPSHSHCKPKSTIEGRGRVCVSSVKCFHNSVITDEYHLFNVIYVN